MALSVGHQHIARSFLAKGILEEKDLQTEIDEIENVFGCGLNDETPHQIVDRIKNKLHHIGMTIEEIIYPIPHPMKFYGLRTTVTGDKISEFSVDFDTKLVKLYQKIVDAACETRGFIKWSRIVQENKRLNEEHRARGGQSRRNNAMEVTDDELRDFLGKMLSMQWLGGYRGLDRENGELVIDVRAVFTLGPRSMTDLRQYIDDRGEDMNIDQCSLCQEVCWLRGAPCPFPQCHLIMHEQCLETYGQRKCPLCQNRWREAPETEDLFGGSFAARPGAQPSVIGDELDDDDEDLESGIDVSSHMDSAFDTPARPFDEDEGVEAQFSDDDSDVDMEE